MFGENLSRSLRRKLSTQRYMEELSCLTGGNVSPGDLCSIEATMNIQERVLFFSGLPCSHADIDFFDKTSFRFYDFISRLEALNDSRVYIWTPRTVDCGAFLGGKIGGINFEFNHDINDEGILVFLTEDLQDRLLLDFYVDDGSYRLRVEVQGNNWFGVKY